MDFVRCHFELTSYKIHNLDDDLYLIFSDISEASKLKQEKDKDCYWVVSAQVTLQVDG